jgi:hypothetical protein
MVEGAGGGFVFFCTARYLDASLRRSTTCGNYLHLRGLISVITERGSKSSEILPAP